MASGGRFDPASGSPEGSTLPTSYSNGQRSSFAAGSLDRSSSFREGSDSRITGSGSSISRGDASPYVDLPSLSQWMNLDSISMGDQKFTRLGELKKALNISSIMLTEDGSFGTALHSKPLSPPMLEDLKRLKSSIIESSARAKDRAKYLVESISKLEKYRHALLSRKRPRNEGLPTERSSGLLSADRSVSGTNSMKMGPQAHQLMSPMDLISPRADDRTKNMIPNRRIRTSLVEVRSEGRTSTLTRPSGLPEKDRELLRTTSGLSIQSDEKARVLAPGGESWDKKMKRKRSVGVAVNRPLDGDHDHKRGMQQRAGNESRSRSIDSHGFRSGYANSIVGGAAQSSGLNVRPIARTDADSVSLDRRDRLIGSDKEKATMKGIAKQNVREGNLSGSPTPVGKLKASRAPRTGSSVMFNATANFARAAGALEGCEQPLSLNKTQGIGGANNNRKRPLSTRASSPRSSSPPVAKWVGQRPQKISRVARRTNLVPPVPNSDESQLDAFTSSDTGARLISGEANGSGPLRRISSASPQFKLKAESVLSPAGFSESEDSGVLDKSKEKGKISEAEDRAVSSVQKAASFVVPSKKKSLMKEETGDGVRRQGRTGRGSAMSRSCLPHSREKVDISTIPKHRKLVTDKIESKSGRPPTKKFSDRKASGRPGHVNASLVLTGEADDDREELVAAVSLAQEASNHACSSTFWRQIEPVFAFVTPDDLTCLQEQKRLAEGLENSLCFQYGVHQNKKDISFSETFISSPGHLFEGKQATLITEAAQNESAKTGSCVDESHVVDTGELGTDRWLERIIPLSQRLLAALIVEDEVSEISCAGGTEREVYQYPSDDSPRGACSHTGNESKDMDRTESEIESMGELKNHMYHSFDNFSSDGSIISNGFKNPEKGLPYKEELALDDGAILNSYNSEHHGADRSDLSDSTISGISSIDCCYQQMPLDDRILLELRSIGLFPEVVPNLSQGEDDEISRDISNLKEGLFQQVKKKKSHLCKLEKVVLQERELQERSLERLALNKLVEIAYKKLMACQGNNKSGGSKISKQAEAAQAFAKRTLARCSKYEEAGASCFREHLRKDDLSGPTCSNDTKCIDASKGEHNVKLHPEAFTSQNQANATAILASRPAVNPVEQCGQHISSLKRDLAGAFQPHAHSSDQSTMKDEIWSGRGKKRELLLDDVVSNAAKGASNLGSGILGGTKGKRSERDRDHSREGVRNSAPKAGRPTAGTVRGERKTKTKPRQKTAQLSTSVNGLLSRQGAHSSMLSSISVSSETAVNGSTKVKEVLPDDSVSAPDPLDPEGPIDLTHLPLPGMEQLGVSDDLDQGLDPDTWWSFPDDGMQDHDQHLVGLSVPMDDLSDVKMIP
ncbi:uncharacterized protein LOC116264010 isoform X2 [Nymphaea colorata]|uniref:uncharacterized protein LOC116264010 isoform X2 n=1 Tax=Nymphaea colorata TaxID=210225 RepID=UPI00129DBC0D|nr:uncharacterized protein LOC116264010 isoform X2 [Nymphaea colorata]